MNEPLWTVEQLAEFLGVPVRTIYAWRYKRKGPPALRVGKHVRFRPADVERWLADRGADVSSARATLQARNSRRMA